MRARSTAAFAAGLLGLATVLATFTACGKSLQCPAGETDCGGHCVSLLSDPSNCGACGVKASVLQVCRAAALACAPGAGSCDGACVDLPRDARNCGACGRACGSGQLCSTAGGGTCLDAAACTGSTSACGSACVALGSDRLNCGACGKACPGAQTCHAGECAADLMVACYATSDVRPVTADLQAAGSPRPIQGGPTVLASAGDYVYSGNGYPASVAAIPLDASLATTLLTLKKGDDIEGIAVQAGIVLASNASTNTLVVVDPGAGVLDEWSLGDYANPHGIATVGSTAYVALYGEGPNANHSAATGQAIAKVDLSALPACVAGKATSCGSVLGTIDLASVKGAADAGAYPFPSRIAALGTKLYVTLANLAYADCGSGYFAYCKPAGGGKLAVIDTSDDSVSIADLGADCKNPGAIAISGTTAWVTCGSFTFSSEAPGAAVPVDLSGAAPAVGAKVDASSVAGSFFAPGAIAVCGGKGYLGDQLSGTVARFDVGTKALDGSAPACPVGPFGYAFVADIACPAE